MKISTSHIKNYLIVICLMLSTMVLTLYFSRIKPVDVAVSIPDASIDAQMLQKFKSAFIKNSTLMIINHPIETLYLEDEQRWLSGTAEMVDYQSKYCALWEAEMTKYMLLLSEKLNEDTQIAPEENMQIALEEEQKSWRIWNDAQVAFYEKYEHYMHDGGTISNVNIVRSQMEQYRARALQLISLYASVMEGRVEGWRWDYNFGIEMEN